MTRISTDPEASADLRARSDSRFRRALAVLVVVLVVACATFLALGFLQGPKLTGAQVDTTAAISQTGQQLRLFANQPLAQVSSDRVTVIPDVPHTVTTQGHVVAVQFNARLLYSTHYRVEVTGVTSVYQNQRSNFDYSFTTATPTLYYLDRGPSTDTVFRTALIGSEHTAVYSAPRIQDFAVLAGSIAVVTLADDNTSSLDLVSLTDGAVEHIALPGAGVIRKLGAAASGTELAFTFTSAGESIQPAYSATLMVLDLEKQHAVATVNGLDGSPVRVLDWRFMPTGSSLLAFTHDNSLLLIDPLVAGSVSPFGQFTELGRVSIDRSSVTVKDAFGWASLRFADGSQSRIEPSLLLNDSSKVYIGIPQVLDGSKRVENLIVSPPGGTRFASVLARDDGSTSTELYRPPNANGTIESFTISPNGQYAAIEVVPDTSTGKSDGYFYDAHDTTAETEIVDLSSGALIRSFAGVSLSWG